MTLYKHVSQREELDVLVVFQIDESAMRVGVRALTAATLSQLASERFQRR